MKQHQKLAMLQVMTTLSAVVCCIMAVVWPTPFFPFAACVFTWQATVVWCWKRYLVDARNVWEPPQ